MVKPQMPQPEKAPLSQVEPLSPPEPILTTTVIIPQVHPEISQPKAKCWYVMSIFATFCCCFPCGLIGMVHAMIASHEGERQNLPGYQRRMRQTRCWTGWSIGLGLLALLGVCVCLSLMFWRYPYCGVIDGDYYRPAEFNSTVNGTTPMMIE